MLILYYIQNIQTNKCVAINKIFKPTEELKSDKDNFILLIIDNEGIIQYCVANPHLGYGMPFKYFKDEGWVQIQYPYYSNPKYYRYPKGASTVAHLESAIDIFKFGLDFFVDNTKYSVVVPNGSFGFVIEDNLDEFVDLLTSSGVSKFPSHEDGFRKFNSFPTLRSINTPEADLFHRDARFKIIKK